jgi:uncharacterized protein (DUF3820 family)
MTTDILTTEAKAPTFVSFGPLQRQILEELQEVEPDELTGVDMPFGRYEGHDIAELPRGYAWWLLEPDWFTDSFGPHADLAEKVREVHGERPAPKPKKYLRWRCVENIDSDSEYTSHEGQRIVIFRNKFGPGWKICFGGKFLKDLSRR